MTFQTILETVAYGGSVDLAVNIAFTVIKIAVVVGVVMLHVAYATYFERKVIGHMQVRMGPMLVGWHGLLQPIADGVKLFFKEDIIPTNADKPTFYIAPVISLLATMSALAVVPFFSTFVVADINIALLYMLALSSMAAYGLVVSGWAANSKYSFLGGLRSSAQVISYEISMGLSLVGVMIMAGSLNLTDIVNAQQHYKWFILPQILGFAVFYISALAETNRTPFDLPEAESELVAGYFTEYSGFRFSIFFMAEYIGMILMSAIGSLCFLGGWHGPFSDQFPILQPFYLIGKMYAFIFLYYWIRATVPRYRYDQLMTLGWKVLIPLALVNIVITATVKIFT